MKLKPLLLTVFTLVSMTATWAADNVATVVKMRGAVKAKMLDGSIIDVKEEQSIPEGAVVQTADKSFVKLLFIDKSQMNLGPNSQMIINAFPKKEAGIITLVKGQIRSQVTKDYMEMDDKSKSKLYIKTKTAAMGIRGTDFQVNFNEKNKNTSLITFEGKVVMAHIGRGEKSKSFNQDKLERIVSSDKAVMVTQGQISAVNLNVSERAMIPTKLGTKQIEALESNETGLRDTNAPSEDSAKQFRNPIPPGADGAAFSNTVAAGTEVKMPTTTAEGFFNVKTGEYKLPAGSVIDLNTVNIIPPPTNAVFDNNSGTFIVPESFGRIDKSTGEYKAPVGLSLGTDGKFIVTDPEAYQKTQAPSKEDKPAEKTEEGNRGPASVGPAAPPTEVKAPELFSGGAAQAFIGTFAVPVGGLVPPPGTTAANRALLSGIAAEILQKNDVAKQAATEKTVVVPNSKVKFIFNAEN